MTSRGFVLPREPGWAVSGPTIGPAFTSTPFRAPAFQAEAAACWQEFLDALGEEQASDEFDLDVSELQPPDLRAVASQLVKESLQTAAQAAAGSGKAASAGAAAAGSSSSKSKRGRGKAAAAKASAAAGAASPPAGAPSRPPSAGKGSQDGRKRPPPVDPSRGRDYTHTQRLSKGPPVAGPDALEPEALAFAIVPRGLRPQPQGPRQQTRKPAGPAFEGEASTLERRLRQEFRDSAQTLRSVRQATAAPIEHMTPFGVKSESIFQRVPLRAAAPAAARTGERLPADEVLLRIDVREFDTVHCTLQEWLVPASQPVGRLRDAISCPADRNLSALGLGVKGAFFYIDGTFLVDSAGLDYSPQILDFCRQHGLQPPPDTPEGVAEALPRTHLQRRAQRRGRRGRQPPEPEEEEAAPGEWRVWDMRRTPWAALGLRVGAAAGHVFCHQGCCEHLVVIRDVRRLHADDPQHAGAYPLCTREEAVARRQCSACDLGMAVKVTYEDEHAPTSPAFWCEACYRAMHYGADGRLQHPHRVFPYTSG